MTEKPLSGLRVLDFTQALAGPYTTTLFADLGAEVIKVEPPGGATQRDGFSGGTPWNLMRNKKSIVIDLKEEQSAEIVEDLVKTSDVFVHNYTPGTMERLGFDYETVRTFNDQIVYLAITGFGETGPNSERRGYDPIAQAYSGLMFNTGEADRKPSRIGGSVVDIGTAMVSAYAAMTGLWQRERTGTGQKVDTSLVETAIMYVCYFITEYSHSGEMPQRQGHTWTVYQPVGVFDTADDPVFVAVQKHQWERFCAALDREEWIDDPRFDTDQARCDNYAALHQEIEDALASYRREDLVELLIEKQIPISELNTFEDVSEDEHLHQRGTLTTVTDRDGNELVVANSPIHFSDVTPEIESPPPELGQHTLETLLNCGYSKDQIEELAEAGVVTSYHRS